MLDQIARRTGAPSLEVWYVTFFNLQQGEARFSPIDVVLSNQGRDYRPLDAVALDTHFSDQRLRQSESATGLLVFDGAIDANQSLTMMIGTQIGSDWQVVLRRVESERSAIRSRAGAKGGSAPGER